MEVNKEEALRCLSIAHRHRSSGNLSSSLKFAKKSVSLYSTPEGTTLVSVVEKEIEINGDGGSSSTDNVQSNGNAPETPTAKASGVEEHVTSAHKRPGHSNSAASGSTSKASGSGDTDKGKKREYTTKQVEVVKRVKSCQHHQYYEILSIERTCTDGDVKKAYKKLALALHPDKNGAPGADEAFKMVSKAFQVLSDANLRAVYDANPNSDPTQRGGGMPSRSGGGMHPGFSNGGGGMYTEINPEDLFNAFFGGGMGGSQFGGSPFGGANVFTFGGPGGFQHFGNPRRRPQREQANEGNTSPLIALLPLLLLVAFGMISILPSLFSMGVPPDPKYAFEATNRYHQQRNTWHRNVPYFVNRAEWDKSALWESVPEGRRSQNDAALYSSKLRSFDRNVESRYIERLRSDCEYFRALQNQQIQNEAGFFGIGANYEKIRQLRAEVNPSCEQLKSWGLQQSSNY